MTVDLNRKTKETDVSISLDLCGGNVSINTGIGFFDHMLTAFAVHGEFGLNVNVTGDLNVDCHHTVEDTGIVLGMAFKEALGDRAGIERYGTFFIPMDESLAMASVDISGRPYLVFEAQFPEERVGAFDTCLTEEFFRAFAFNAGITLHTRVLYGKNAHHMIEAMFKAAAHAMKSAVTKRKSSDKPLSTKGVL